jgi:hypothetical protein
MAGCPRLRIEPTTGMCLFEIERASVAAAAQVKYDPNE